MTALKGPTSAQDMGQPGASQVVSQTVSQAPDQAVSGQGTPSAPYGDAGTGVGAEAISSAMAGRPRASSAPRGAASTWTDGALWRRRAMRLLGIWALLSVALVGLRVSTAGIRPELREAVTTHEQLVKERDALSLEVQTLGAASRVTQWAKEAGMLRFADSVKRSADISGVGLPEKKADPNPVQMKTQWGAGPQAGPASRSGRGAERAAPAQEAPAP